MNKNALALFAALLAVQFVQAQSTIIPTFKSPQNQYDYLIVSPVKFLAGADKLAQFRHSFSGYKAGVVILDSLYAGFDSTGRKPSDKIWFGLKYAMKSWSVAPKFVVLIGNDSLAFKAADSTWISKGDMPVVAYGTTPNFSPQSPPQALYSDDNYAFLKDSLMPIFPAAQPDKEYGIAIGRIPCDSAVQCERYVQKVIDFENNKHAHSSWFNCAMVVSDDTIQGSSPDALGTMHLRTAEKCSNDLLKSWFVNKIVGCASAPGINSLKPIVEDSVVATINRGNLWSIYIGHGAPGIWSDEQMLIANDITRFHNDSFPSVFVSFSCRDADFLQPFANSMCKRFLFSTHGGAIAYLGATGDAYANENADLMTAFFSTCNQNPQIPLGQALTAAKTTVFSQNSLSYAFLGDPALTLSNGHISVSMTRNSQSQISLACQAGNGSAASGNFDVRFFKRDTVKVGSGSYISDSLISRQTGTFTTGFSITPPSNKNVRIVVFVWNENGEGRIDSLFSGLTAAVATPGIQQHQSASGLRIANGKLILQLGSLHDATVRFTAFTLDGKICVVKDIRVGSSEISVDPKSFGLAAGTYFFRFSTAKAMFTQRMILSR